MRIARLVIPILLLCTSIATAQNTSALINQAMDKQVKLEIDATLPDALEQIEKETAVPIKASPIVWDVLPWGEQTNVKVKIENQTLRQALSAITQKLGLTFDLQDEAVQLEPVPALRRLGKRATLQEVAAVDALASLPLDPATHEMLARGLIDAVDAQLVAAKSPFAVENRATDSEIRSARVDVPRNVSCLDALEAMARQSNITWYPWGRSIVVLGKQEQIHNQLMRTITLRFDGIDVSQVLLELSERASVTFFIEPGAVQRIAPEFRKIRLVLDNATIEQTLESLSGFTGLNYTITRDGVTIWNLSPTPPDRRAATSLPATR